jgi:pimeloyl-ACP methyl ester carboxylesterase
VPLRGLQSDSAYIARVIAQIPGPVLAVGHSYGGAVISNAATQATNVKGLVLVSGFAPEEGEALGEVEGTSETAPRTGLIQAEFPTGAGNETAIELYVDPAKFPAVFAADLPISQANAFAASQRPIAASAFDEKSGPPAWKHLPTWSVVATGDKAAGSDVLLSMARRANAETLELEGSHLIMVSQPEPVTDVILAPLETVGRSR